jgi:polyphosphate kinase
MARARLNDPRFYFNRHESWLAFNRRVLEEALDESNPLLEKGSISWHHRQQSR